MAEVIYNYPKSSCSCWECNKKKFPVPTGPPTNMSVPGCNYSGSYDCNPTRRFKVQQEPNNKYGHTLLNKSVVAPKKHDGTFEAIDVKDCPNSSCSGTTYLNSDPRLYNAAAATWLQLNRPPLSASTKLDTLNSNKSLDNYGQGYKSYADINAGQYLYYIDKDREDVLFEPLFSEKATVVGTMYKDPMGSMKPVYDRIPHNQQDYGILADPCNVSGNYCLSFIKDTQGYREDLLSIQMRKRNQERYSPRWTNI